MGAVRHLADASKAKILALENRLSGVFKPITPRKEFVRNLSHRIQAGSQASVVSRLADWHFFAMLAAGLVSFIVLLAVLVRSLLALFGRRTRKRAEATHS